MRNDQARSAGPLALSTSTDDITWDWTYSSLGPCTHRGEPPTNSPFPGDCPLLTDCHVSPDSEIIIFPRLPTCRNCVKPQTSMIFKCFPRDRPNKKRMMPLPVIGSTRDILIELTDENHSATMRRANIWVELVNILMATKQHYRHREEARSMQASKSQLPLHAARSLPAVTSPFPFPYERM